ncbi:MAG: gfo/Idh/MocA family oxidoreductase [Rhizobiales bacterium]|nr:gfo/Idh/MocA family oxidoreductase [Hyphomicrobiales bacterium]
MSSLPKLKFAAIGLDHRHIYDQVTSLLDIGVECVGFWSRDEAMPLQGFMEKFPYIPRVKERAQLLEDKSIHLITCAAIPNERADLAIEAMRHGKDFMVDKPGLTTFGQLEAVRKVQKETGRIFSIDFTERFEVRSTTRAGELVKAGAIGQVVHTAGLGPHRLNRHLRPQWFFDKQAYGGILVDIGSHQFDQFLYFTDSSDARITAARVANRAHPADTGLEDLGEVMIESDNASGYFRVDWFTPDGLNTWGDGRLTIVGTEGTIELRKYVDVAGRPGIDHLFLTDKKSSRYIDCSDAELTYYPKLRDDIFNRTETAMTHDHCFKVCELSLTAQAMGWEQQARSLQANK